MKSTLRNTLLVLVLLSGVYANGQTTPPKSLFDDIEFRLDDNGKKWEVTPGIREFMTKSIELATKKAPQSKGQAKKMGKKLVSLSDKMIEKCSMTSDGHYVFHTWLLVYLDVLDEFVTIEFEEDIPYILPDLERAFKEYNTYFQ